MADNRLNRELETREKTTRKKAWNRPEVLPTPNPEPGYAFRWVRISTRGGPQVDWAVVSSERQHLFPGRLQSRPAFYFSR